jgi:Recombination endonuclease VII
VLKCKNSCTDFDEKIRRCHKCLEWKSFSEYNKDNYRKCGGGFGYTCKKCMSIYRKTRPALRMKGQSRFYGNTPPDINDAELLALIAAHSGVCDFKSCESPALMTDHCHTTGKVRGRLCGPHNRGLGLFKDNVQYLKDAIEYLTAKDMGI